ncbi:hypothetical protein IJI28_03255 [Candidatus Saccharibacteria bacterium]|nr:hypothetical protein [Candidatus Saccharibacteria bacterium]
MNNSNYEKEFINSIKQTGQQIPLSQQKLKIATNTSKPHLAITIILAIIVLIESVALAILAFNYGEVLDLYGNNEPEYNETTNNDSPEALSNDNDFTYGENYEVTAFNLICTNGDGSKYTFTKSKNYQKTDTSLGSTESGTYSIVNGGAVILNNPNQTEEKIVYYNGYDIMEGTTFYTCDK